MVEGINVLIAVCLLYLCIFITVVGIVLLSYLAGLNEQLPISELSYYANKAVNFFQRADDMNGANRFFGWLYQYDELQYWEGALEWERVQIDLKDSLEEEVNETM